jgi:hypothetical protein
MNDTNPKPEPNSPTIEPGHPDLGALMTWDNPLAEHRDTDLDEDDCDCPQDDGDHEWWCPR